MLTKNMKFSQRWKVNNVNSWFTVELTSITSNWWQFLIKKGSDGKIKN